MAASLRSLGSVGAFLDPAAFVAARRRARSNDRSSAGSWRTFQRSNSPYAKPDTTAPTTPTATATATTARSWNAACTPPTSPSQSPTAPPDNHHGRSRSQALTTAPGGR